MKLKAITFICLLPSAYATAGELSYDFPTNDGMAKSLFEEIVGADVLVNRSLRIDHLDVSPSRISVLFKAAAIDTSKPKQESLIPDGTSIKLTKKSVINKYCAPFGFGDLYFDTFYQRGVKLEYSYVGAGDVPIFSFSVSKKDCSI
ncbi:hypothetical protein [Serratia marcescens]|uniref:hypothetical protein n=1 Tax=Serratia marcescens TaxID=615 RepID=UPI0014961F51|nr:hypothetical protein [Serratia marcescens]